MSLINGKGGADSHEHYSVPATLSGRGPNPAIQLAVLRHHSGKHWCGVAGTAVSAEARLHSTFARHYTGAVLAGLIAAGVALCLRPLSALRSELGLPGTFSGASAMD